METRRKPTLSALPAEPESSTEPSSQPQSGTVLRCDALIESDDDEPTIEFPQEVARLILNEDLREFCARWPDQPHPALGGETPRKFALTAAGRSQLAVLLADMQQHTRGTPIADAWDFEQLRFELGLALVPSSVSAKKAQ